MIGIFLPEFPFRGRIAPYLWVFYRLLHSLGEDALYIVGKSYVKSVEYMRLEHRDEVTLMAMQKFSYFLPSASKIAAQHYDFIDDKIFESLFDHCGRNHREAFRLFLSEEYPPLVRWFRKHLRGHTEIEFLITWCNCPSLEKAAQEMNIPVVHLEHGPLRSPDFRSTGYVDFSGVNGNTEAWERYRAEAAGLTFDLKMEEMLRFFRRLPYPSNMGEPTFELGLPFQVEDDSNLIAFGKGFDNLGALRWACMHASSKGILIRPHPAGHFQPLGHLPGVLDASPTAVDFLARVQRVVTINSSIGLEAILSGLEVSFLGDSSAAFIMKMKDQFRTEDMMAFYLFGYLVPEDLMFDANYLRFRTQRPSFDAIVRRHIRFYLGEAGAGFLEEHDIPAMLGSAVRSADGVVLKSDVSSQEDLTNLQMPKENGLHFQFYFSNEFGDFSEDFSVAAALHPGMNNIVLEFDTAALGDDWKLRCDPINSHGVVQITRLNFWLGGRCVKLDCNKLQLGNCNDMFEVGSGRSEMVILSISDDPHFEVDINQLRGMERGQLKIEVDVYVVRQGDELQFLGEKLASPTQKEDSLAAENFDLIEVNKDNGVV